MTPTIRPWTRFPDYDSPKDMSTPMLDFDPAVCRKCDICTSICPARSIDRDGGKMGWNGGIPYLKSNFPEITNCVACGCCIAACPSDAIRITRNFVPGEYYTRLTQTRDLVWPKKYLPEPGERGPVKKTNALSAPDAAAPQMSLKEALSRKAHILYWAGRGISGAGAFLKNEIRNGRTSRTLGKFLKGETFDISWAELLEQRAADIPDKTCLLFNDERFTYREMDDNANRLANFLHDTGGDRGKGLGIIMRNSPRFLDLFFGSQKIGMYTVPVNPELRGDGLVYIVNHSDISRLVVDADLLDTVLECMDRFDRIGPSQIVVNDIDEGCTGIDIPSSMLQLSDAYGKPAENPDIPYHPEDICLIIYTSGTTGPPKGVVYRYNTSGVLLLSLGGRVFYNPDDVYYTYLALCHGNALFVTVTMSLAVGCTIALSRRFSASRFWDTVREYGATVFNTIGTIIPILMKQPERPDDRNHSVRIVMSAACPADMWKPFEERFGVKIYEAYGAVDGGGKGIMNLGTAPPGSLGKPPAVVSARIVDEQGNDVPDNTPGELMFSIRNGKSPVEYYKNPEASEKKSKDGWLRTGDIIRRDKKGYFYFVGRNTESMRKGGENVSAYEVEHVIMQHEGVEDVAVYAVPSELGEDEIMASVKTVNGNPIDPSDLRLFLSGKLARYAIPRYIRFVDEFPKTNTHRIIKKQLEDEGVTVDTFDGLNP
jgi:crotonobetaine/carnitine-CoA ligase